MKKYVFRFLQVGVRREEKALEFASNTHNRRRGNIKKVLFLRRLSV